MLTAFSNYVWCLQKNAAFAPRGENNDKRQQRAVKQVDQKVKITVTKASNDSVALIPV